MELSKSAARLLAFGTGVGIEVGGKDLDVTAVRVRPSGVHVLGHLTIAGFRNRPAAEWGAEYAAFLRSHAGARLAATVLLPRGEVIVRHLPLPGVAPRDIGPAIAFQIDALHPYGDEGAVYGWSRVEGGVLLGVMRRAILDRYLELFNEAGIAVASCTFSAGVMHGAHRLPGAEPRTGFVAIGNHDSLPIEIYGESAARPVFSAAFDPPVDRALALAAAELRLPPDTEPIGLEHVLPPANGYDLASRPLTYATAITSACPRLARTANLLPPERRRSNSRAMLIPSVVLGVLALGLCGALFASSALHERRYLATLDTEIARVEPVARRSADLDRRIGDAQNRTRLLDGFRSRSKADLDALNALTRLLVPPIWASAIELTRDAVNINGEAEQAAPLLKVLDTSPLFQNSEFAAPLERNRDNNAERFRIHTMRKGGR